LSQAGERAVVAARPGLFALARFGLFVKGALQLLIGLLALAAAAGDRRGRVTDAAGALWALAGEPLGRPLMLLLAVGLFAYAGLRFVQGLFDPQRRPRRPSTVLYRIADVFGGVGYVLLGTGAARLFMGLGGPSTSDARNRALTAETLALPYGPRMLMAFVVILAVLALLFLLRAFVVRDVCGDLAREEMSPATGHVAAVMIRIASLLQAVLFGTMATFFYRAARLHDARAVRGMGGVLRFLGQGHGTAVLVLLALGFVIMSGTSFIEARWRKLA
jgi:hypothetical protein